MAEEKLKITLEYDAKNKKAIDDAVNKLNELGKVTTTSSASTSGLAKGMTKLAGSLGLTGGAIGGVTTALLGMASATAVATAGISILIGILVALGKSLADIAKFSMDFSWRLRDTAMRTGSTIEEMSKFNFVAKQSGMTLDELSKTIEVFDLKVSNMQSAGKKTKNALVRLGIEIADNNGKLKTSIELFTETMRAMEQMGNTDVSEVGTDIGGRLGSARMIRIARGFSEKLRDANKYAQLLDSYPFGNWIALKGVAQDIAGLFEIFKLQIGEAILPLVEQILPAFRSLFSAIVHSNNAMGLMKELFEIIGVYIGFILDKLQGWFRIGDAIFTLFADMFSGTMTMGEAWSKFMNSIFQALKGMVARPLIWVWDKFALFFAQVAEWGMDMVATYAEQINKVGTFINGMVGAVANGIAGLINLAIDGIAGMINWIIGKINEMLSSVNWLTNKISDITGGAVDIGTDLRLNEVNFGGAKDWVSGIASRVTGISDSLFGDLAGSMTRDLQTLSNYFRQENPFEEWLFERGGVDAPAVEPPDKNVYERLLEDTGNALGKVAKSAKKVNDELNKQVQAYQVVYGQIFGARGFFDLLGQVRQPTYPSFKTGSGIELATTGGLTPITIQNMTVRNDTDIVRIASELDKLQKKDARKKGFAYGF